MNVPIFMEVFKSMKYFKQDIAKPLFCHTLTKAALA